MKQTRRRHKSEGQALDKPNYELIKPPKVTKKTKTKQELENQEHVHRRILRVVGVILGCAKILF